MPEVELKFAVAERDRQRVSRSSALAGARPLRRRLLTLYLDTPEGLLWKRGMALRLRKAGAHWIQSVKGGRSGRGGLHTRDEWEFDRPDASLDLALFARTPLARVPGADRLHERLAVAFTVDVMRTAWTVSPTGGTRLEVALDVGEVRSGARTERICEIEIECLEGPVAAAFDLAARLLGEVPMRASMVTKAERGWRLVRGGAPKPRKARSVALDASAPLEHAAREIVGAALEQLQANEEGVIAGSDPEFVHQARVGLRRLRSALRMFRRTIGRKRSRAWRNELGRLSAALGVARDWDVFALESLPAALSGHADAALAERLGRAAKERSLHARRDAALAIVAPRSARTLLAISRWLACSDEPRAAGGEALTAFAVRALAKRHERLLARARHVARLDAAGRHRLRIEAKRLRYGVDGLASLFPAVRTERYREALAQLQDALGEANDAATAARLVAKLDAPPALIHRTRQLFAAKARGDTARIANLVRRLRLTGAPGSARVRA